MYCINGNSSWYNDCGPLFGGCPLLGVSVIGGSTVYLSSLFIRLAGILIVIEMCKCRQTEYMHQGLHTLAKG